MQKNLCKQKLEIKNKGKIVNTKNMADINSNVSIITLNMNGLNTLIKWKCLSGSKTRSNYMLSTRNPLCLQRDILVEKKNKLCTNFLKQA
jgi:hypothetical protein